MRGTKWFCILLGVFLVLFTVIPAPFGLLLESALGVGLQTKVREMIHDGTFRVNAQELVAKHGTDPGGQASVESPGDADATAALIVARSAIRSVSGLGASVTVGTLLMGLLWIGVGVRIPSTLSVGGAHKPT